MIKIANIGPRPKFGDLTLQCTMKYYSRIQRTRLHLTVSKSLSSTGIALIGRFVLAVVSSARGGLSRMIGFLAKSDLCQIQTDLPSRPQPASIACCARNHARTCARVPPAPARDAHIILLKLPNIQFLNFLFFPMILLKVPLLFSVIVTITNRFLPTGGVLT